MMILGLFSVGLSLVFFVLHSLLGGTELSASEAFYEISFSLFLHLLLPLISALIGTGIIANEVEERTLIYLLTRPQPKWKIILAKTLAGYITAGLILLIALLATYSVMSALAGDQGWMTLFSDLSRICGVLLLGLLVYLPLFGVLGAFLKKPVLAGLLFTFGWENLVAYIPGKIRLFTVVHYLHDLFPHFRKVRGNSETAFFLNIFITDQDLSTPISISILVLLAALFTGLLLSVLYLREYRLEQN